MGKLLIFVILIVIAVGYFILFPPLQTGTIETSDFQRPPELTQEEENEICIQVITPARNPETGEVVEFPTPCDVPDGWEPVLPEGLDLQAI